jgi:hypothetical protein
MLSLRFGLRWFQRNKVTFRYGCTIPVEGWEDSGCHWEDSGSVRKTGEAFSSSSADQMRGGRSTKPRTHLLRHPIHPPTIHLHSHGNLTRCAAARQQAQN